MDTRLHTRLRAGGNHVHYQQFDYDYSSSDPERARFADLLSDAPDLSEAEPPALLDTLMPPDEQRLSPEPANDDNLPLLTQHGVVAEISQTQDVLTATEEAEVSLASTSAQFLTNSSLTDGQSMFPHCRMTPPTSKKLKPVTPGYQAPTSCLLGTTFLAHVVGAGRELVYLI